MVDALIRWLSLSFSPRVRWYPSRCSRWRTARSVRPTRPPANASLQLTGQADFWHTTGSCPAAPQRVIKRTRTCGVWAASALSALVLVLLLIFVLENGQRVNIGYFGFHRHLALGVALLFAATRGCSCW